MAKKYLDYDGLAYLLSKLSGKILSSSGSGSSSGSESGSSGTSASVDWNNLTNLPSWMSSTIGSETTPVYILNGVPTACSASLSGSGSSDGSGSSGGSISGSISGTIGSATTPVYINDGTLTSCYEMVTLATDQTVTGLKTFSNGLNVGSVKFSETSSGVAYIDGNLVVKGYITMYATGSESSGESGSSGSTEIASLDWSKLTNLPSWMSSTIGSATNPVYILNGVPTACGSSLAVDITGNAATATTATKVGTATVGGEALPIYLNAGVPTACTASSLFSALSSSSSANLSVTVAGQSRTISELYAAMVKTGVYSSGNLYLAGSAASAEGYDTLQKATGHYVNGDTLHSGNGLFTGYLTMYYTSDRREKENIRLVKDAAARLMALGRVYDFDYKEGASAPYRNGHVGLMYQEVKEAMPQLTREKGGRGAIDYIDPTLISLVVGAGQEHEARIQRLERENKELKEKINQLERRAA